MKKKTILVVDKQKYIEETKRLCAENPDFNFIFATSRKEAEILFPSCDALITTSSLPFDENSIESYKRVYSTGDSIKFQRANADLLILDAAFKNKPSFLIETGGLDHEIYNYYKFSVEKLNSQRKAEVNLFSQKMETLTGSEVTDKNKAEYICDLIKYYGKKLTPNWKLRLDKESREMLGGLASSRKNGINDALSDISEEFKLNEKPVEIKPFKMQ